MNGLAPWSSEACKLQSNSRPSRRLELPNKVPYDFTHQTPDGVTSVADTGSVGALVCVVLGSVRMDTVLTTVRVVTSVTITRTVLVV